ncbi:MAG: carboxypeptidase-like regulatory domain-containing protein, partial [Bacteroidota bacterium]
MKIKFTLLLLCFSFFAWSQTGTIKGTVTDENGDPLVAANVLVQEILKGEITDASGTYTINVAPGDYTVVVSYIGYADMRKTVTVTNGAATTVDFSLSPGTQLDEVVVSGSRRPEKLTESPATIETIFARQIEEYAGNPGELIARQKGVDYFRAGIATPAFNIRGFNSNFNAKNLQVTDNRFSTLVATGLPFGPLNTTIKEDIERVEIILGPNATLYGPNAHNGLLNTITKDPRRSPGTAITLNPGVSGDGDAFYSARLRHAQVLSDKFAFKVTGEYTSGTEFEYVDSVYIDRVGAFDADGKPIPDGISEGYEEFELDRDVEFIRGEASIFYNPTDKFEINFNTGHSSSTYLSPTNVGRNQIKDWRIGYYQLKLSGDNWFVQGYYTQSTTDSTYSIDERTKQYYRGLDAGLSPAVAGGDFSYASGALFQDASRRWNAEAQYNNTFGNLGLITGVQYQLDQANSLGTYLLDENEDDFIDIGQIGGYVHLTYEFGDGFKALAAARADNHDNYGFNFVPKFGLLKIGDQGTWRLTYGQGIAAPTILNQYGNLFNGLILGNAEGFTLVDGTELDRQRVEKIQTFELGYRGQVVENKFFIDANAYYNISSDFLSPVTIVFASERAGVPLRDVQDDALYDLYQALGL